MAAKDRMNQDDMCRVVTKVKKGRMKCPWCGRWNNLDEIDWILEYEGSDRYAMSSLTYCLSCENEMFVELRFKGLKIKEEKE